MDLIIVSPGFEKIEVVKCSWNFYKFWYLDPEINYPINFICYTPEEFEKQKKRISIVSMVLKEGVEIN